MTQPPEPIEWESVSDTENRTTERLRVPGGWLYRETLYKRFLDERDHERWHPVSVALAFVPEAHPQPQPEARPPAASGRYIETGRLRNHTAGVVPVVRPTSHAPAKVAYCARCVHGLRDVGCVVRDGDRNVAVEDLGCGLFGAPTPVDVLEWWDQEVVGGETVIASSPRTADTHAWAPDDGVVVAALVAVDDEALDALRVQR